MNAGFAWAWSLSLLIGCGGASAPIETPIYAVSTFDLGRPNPDESKIVAGLNLDDRVSDSDDASTCKKADFTSPGPDFERGVDNQFGPLLDLAPSDPTAAVAPAIASGAFLIQIRLGEVEDLENDGRVSVELDVAQPEGVFRLSGEIHDGRLEATGDLLAFDLPVTDAGGADATMPMRLTDPRIRMTVTPDAIRSGVLGGAMSVDEAIAGALVLDFAPEDALQLVLGGSADLDPDDQGNCRRISSGFVFEATATSEEMR